MGEQRAKNTALWDAGVQYKGGHLTSKVLIVIETIIDQVLYFV